MDAKPNVQSVASDLRQNIDILLGLLTIFAFPIVIWTTRLGTWGSRYLDRFAALGILWPLFFGGLYGIDPGLEAVFQFWCFSLVVLLFHRIQGMRRLRRGYRCHSRYWGESLLERRGMPTSPRSARMQVNALAVVFGFVVNIAISKPLGVLMILGAIAKLISEQMTYQAAEARLRQMEDARLENEYYLGLFRQRFER